MQIKEHLPVRLEAALLERLTGMAASRWMEIPDLISAALDALERSENLDEELALVTGKLELLHEKMPSAEKIRSLFQIMEKQLIAHDQAEQARFDQLRGSRTEYPGADTEQVQGAGTEQPGGAGTFY